MIFTNLDYFNRDLTAWPNEPDLPKSERGTCGAKTRKGTSCKAPPVWNKETDKAKNGRCKLHGGLSTGAKTEAGRQAIREGVKASNLRRGKQDKSTPQAI
jgi:hypothetical protein